MEKKLIKKGLKPFSDINLVRKMKLTVFFIIVVCQISATNSYAQKAEITLKLSNVTLRDAIRRIEKQTEFVFFYNNDKIDLDQKVSLDIKNGTITALLDQLADKYSYTVENKQILLMPA
ncbi:MAG: STN domain-containing protein, partial [Tannerella sp.]|nr:STN domain-containing protein [Tannerella sp.]